MGKHKSQNEMMNEEGSGEIGYKKKHKKSHKAQNDGSLKEDTDSPLNTDLIQTSSSCRKKKKKKKKKHHQCNEVDGDNADAHHEIVEKEIPSVEKKKKHKVKSSNMEGDHIYGEVNMSQESLHVELCDKKKSMSKNKKHKHKYDLCEAASEEPPVKIKKHKHKHADIEEPTVDVEIQIVQKKEYGNGDNDKPAKKKKKKRMIDDDEDISTANSLPHGATKTECVSNARGDTNLILVESCLTSKGQPVAPVHGVTGQWHTASFENDERQNKFLRLLGGFKKDNKADTGLMNKRFGFAKTKFDNVSIGGNVAMTNKEEDKYKKAMANEYDKAMGFNAQRGLGLGFEKPASEGKKFHIDVNKSKSVKFDD